MEENIYKKKRLESRFKTLELAKKRYNYNPETGEITNKKGHVMKRNDGNIHFVVDRKSYSIKRSHLAYYLLTDQVADLIIHINGDKDDNRFWNLKAVPWEYKLQNQACQGFIKLSNGKFGAQVSYTENGRRKMKWLGCFTTKEEAKRKYLEEKKKIHLEFSMDRFTFKHD